MYNVDMGNEKDHHNSGSYKKKTTKTKTNKQTKQTKKRRKKTAMPKRLQKAVDIAGNQNRNKIKCATTVRTNCPNRQHCPNGQSYS